jgi:hypothetical protein
VIEKYVDNYELHNLRKEKEKKKKDKKKRKYTKKRRIERNKKRIKKRMYALLHICNKKR